MGLSRPPRPTMTFRLLGSQFFSFRKSRMISLRKSFWSMTLAYLAISSVGWRRVSSNSSVSSSNTPTLVEVEPGLMTSVLIDILSSPFCLLSLQVGGHDGGQGNGVDLGLEGIRPAGQDGGHAGAGQDAAVLALGGVHQGLVDQVAGLDVGEQQDVGA